MSYFSSFTRALLPALLFLYGAAAQAQAFADVEPNNACFEAQNIGPISLPTTVVGSLDSTPEIPDVDFFLFQGTPGQSIQVDLEGSTTGAGTLGDPFLGLFDSDCGLLAINDDSNGLNSRLVVVVPDNGLFVLGVSICCDNEFLGGGVGSYLLTLNVFSTIHSISGRLVNATTGDPLSGSDPTYAYVYLFRCSTFGCYEFVSNQQADLDGGFTFQVDQIGNPLGVGTYQIQGNANGFESFTGEPFDVAEGEMRDLGDLALVPLQVIGSISGRLVDALTGDPLPGNVPPYPYLFLNRCEDWGCYGVAYVGVDDMGHFRVEGYNYNLGPGMYQLVGQAQQDYQPNTSPTFAVAAFENVDVGDFALTPYPIQFGAIQACEVPFGGEACEYSIEVVNRGPGRFRGHAWSSVEFYNPSNTSYYTRFQVGRGGMQHPAPERLNLKKNQSETLTFYLDIPGSVPVGSTVCAYITVGKDPIAQFNSQGERFIFCSYKDSAGVVALPTKEGRQRASDLKERDHGSERTQRTRNADQRGHR